MCEAKELLIQRNASCISIKDGVVYQNDRKGVLPLLEWLEDPKQPLLGASVADKVIGRAAALLFVKGQVREIFSFVISDLACEVFEAFHIPYTFERKVPYIVNRRGDGMCPMEEATKTCVSPEEAYWILKEKVSGKN